MNALDRTVELPTWSGEAERRREQVPFTGPELRCRQLPLPGAHLTLVGEAAPPLVKVVDHCTPTGIIRVPIDPGQVLDDLPSTATSPPPRFDLTHADTDWLCADHRSMQASLVRAEAELAGATAERDALIAKLGELLPPLDVDAIIERGDALATDAAAATRARARADVGKRSARPTAPTPTPTAPAPPRQQRVGTPDYTAIAPVHAALVADGKGDVVRRLARAFNVPQSTARNWPPRLRHLAAGNDQPTKPATNAGPPAKSDQEPVSSAVEERSHGLSAPAQPLDTAGERPGAAPATEPAAEVAPPPTNHDVPLPAMVFACEDPGCRYTSPHTVDGRADMRSHVDKQHHRRASTMELTPGLPD